MNYYYYNIKFNNLFKRIEYELYIIYKYNYIIYM